MPLLQKFPKNFFRSKFLLTIITLLSGILLVSGIYIYKDIKEPDLYNPKGDITHVSPVSKSQFKNIEAIVPKEPSTKALLPGAKWVPQTFNNCGPATTSMVLQYFGFDVDQNKTKEALRTNSDDKNVFTYEMAEYLRNSYGIESKLFYGGDIDLIKKLLANGFYVVLEDWLHPNEDIGHVTIIRGFDDEEGVLIADDSFIGVNITYPYEKFSETQWKAFNYEYLPVYRSGNEELLKAIVGDDWDEKTMYQNAANKALSEIKANPNDMYAYFNLGTSYYALGKYIEAKTAFEKSQSIGWPKRMLWYQIQPIQTYNALGEYQKALELSDIALAGNESFAEVHLEKGVAYKGLGNLEKARDEANTALFYYPNLKVAQDFLASF